MKKLLLLLLLTINTFSQQKKKPNILFILLDDLGKEWVSEYGADYIKTPTIDKLAKEGMQFQNAWSMPQCTPSRVTLMTGQYPWRHGWINHFDVPRWGHGVNFDSDKNPSFAKVMQNKGYKTCAAGKWQINDFRLQPEAMVEHGFNNYCMWTGAEGGGKGTPSQKRYWDPYIHTKEGSKTYKGQFGEDIFSDFIIDFMKENKEDPMLIYYPMCLPHGPLVHTPEFPKAESKMDKHKAMVSYTDFILNKLLTALEDLKIRDNTIIFWTTDNGTSGSVVGSLDGRLVRGGKTYLTENGVGAPFIVNCPGKVQSGVITEALIDFTDMLPTFADLGGVKVPKKLEIDGKSFAPLILGNSNDSSREWTMALGSRAGMIDENGKAKNVYTFRDRVIKDKKYKAFVNTDKEIYEIFEFKKDLNEENNLISSNNIEVTNALKKFQKVINSLPNEDANPKYDKLEGSFYDISVEKLNKDALKATNRGNHCPKPKVKK